MTDPESRTLVFRNQAGDYFPVSPETIERGRVADEHKVEVQHLLAEAESEDVSGYIFSFLAELFAIHTGAALAVSEDIPVLRLPTS